MDQDNNVQAAVDAGMQIAEAKGRIVEVQGIPMALVPQGMTLLGMRDVLDEAEKRGPAPLRLKGTATHQELDSFIQHVNRFKDGDSAIFADVGTVKLTAVFNYHLGQGSQQNEGNPARWADHRAIYACPLSTEWKLWMKMNETWMNQEAFGQFIEDNLKDLANPDPANSEDKDKPEPARVLEVARSLVINAKTEFQRTINPSTGEGVFAWKKDNEVQGTTKVPKSFLIGIPVFDAGDSYRMEARLRYTVDNGVAKFQYALYQPQVTLRDAFSEVRKKAKEATGLPVFAGSPES